MPKRFTDTAIWEKQWFRKLGPVEKNAWFYILARCDAVGVWDADTELAEFCIGNKVDWDALRAAANGNIEVLDNGKWWLADFVKYQYGELREGCRPHQTYIKMLQQHGLIDYAKGTGTLKEKELELEKEKEKEERAHGVMLTTAELAKLETKYGADNTKAALAKLSAYKLQSGRKYASDYGAILHWVMDEVVKKAGPRAPTPGWTCAKCGKVNNNTGGLCTCGEVRP